MLVAVVVSWSAHAMLRDRLVVLATTPMADAKSLTQRFVSIMSTSHATGLLMLPLLWVEACRLQRDNEAACARLMVGIVGTLRRKVFTWPSHAL